MTSGQVCKDLYFFLDTIKKGQGTAGDVEWIRHVLPHWDGPDGYVEEAEVEDART